MTTISEHSTPRHGSSSGWLHDRSERLVRRMAERWLFRATARDLSRLDDAILRDIGLTRDRIPEIAAEDAARVASRMRLSLF